jgi:hypothetical protein
MTMKNRTIAAEELQAEGLGLIDRMEQTQEPLIVTNRGRPVVGSFPCEISHHDHFGTAIRCSPSSWNPSSTPGISSGDCSRARVIPVVSAAPLQS